MDGIATCSTVSKALTIELGNNFYIVIIIIAFLLFAFKYISLCSRNVDGCTKCKDRLDYLMKSRK